MYMQVYLGNLETHDAEGFYAAPAPYDHWGASECQECDCKAYTPPGVANPGASTTLWTDARLDWDAENPQKNQCCTCRAEVARLGMLGAATRRLLAAWRGWYT